MARLPHHTPTILELDLTQPLVDPRPGDPLGQLRNRGRRLLRPTIKALHEAAADPRVLGLVAKVGGPLSWSTMHELRRGLQPFLDARKPTVAWAESFPDGPAGTCAYVLASGFDEVWLQPGGGLGLLGVAVETTFLRGALDKLGVEPQFEQRHEYKNAADRLTRTEFTPAHRESLDALAGVDLHRRGGDHRGRPLPVGGPGARARRLRPADGGGGPGGAPGRPARLSRRGAEPRCGSGPIRPPSCCSPTGGGRGPSCGCPVGTVSTWRWSRSAAAIGSGRSRPGRWAPRPAATPSPPSCGPRLTDDHVRGVVLRVDSPGGSAVASDVIWREVCRVREAGKPVVVSMGDVAASGGYYVACPADRIVALPSTLTGSIGVLGGKFVTSELWEKVGLTTGAVEHGERAACGRPSRLHRRRARAAERRDRRHLRRLRGQGRRRSRTYRRRDRAARPRTRLDRAGRVRDRAGRRAGWAARRRPDRAPADRAARRRPGHPGRPPAAGGAAGPAPQQRGSAGPVWPLRCRRSPS